MLFYDVVFEYEVYTNNAKYIATTKSKLQQLKVFCNNEYELYSSIEKCEV